MNASLFRRAALTSLALLPLLSRAGAAQSSSDFETLLKTGFQDVRANASAAVTPEPPAREIAPAPGASGGVFLHSSLDGRVAYCSATGCRLLLNGGAGVVVLAGPGAFYFSGPEGTGYCDTDRCRVLLATRVTFPLMSGPKGDIYGSDQEAGWHCTPDACSKASDVPLQRYANYIEGVYKPSGDFVSSSADGAFWCSEGKCARIGAQEMIFVESGCAGTAPARAAYAFASSLYRCTPAGCREFALDERVDNYAQCAFDERGRLLLPARDAQGRHAAGSVQVSKDGVALSRRELSSIPSAPKAAGSERSSESFVDGSDGATYRLTSRSADADPAADAPRRLNGEITRSEGGRDAVLAFDVPVECWQWTDGDGDENQPMWSNECRVLR